MNPRNTQQINNIEKIVKQSLNKQQMLSDEKEVVWLIKKNIESIDRNKMIAADTKIWIKWKIK